MPIEPGPVQVEAVCIIKMDGTILEADFEVVGVKLGRVVFNAILGYAGCEILLCFLHIIEEVTAKVIFLIAKLDIRRGNCCRVCRWLDREIF
jgi:hypothetical protein